MAKLKANMIIEIMGRPPKYVSEALNTLVVKLGSEKGVSLLNKKYHDPQKVEKSKTLYATFAEIEVELDSLEMLFNILMTYSPSNIEVYEPDNFKLKSHELNEFANYVVARMHKYDISVKQALQQRDILVREVQKLRSGVVEITDSTGQKKADKKPAKKAKKPKASGASSAKKNK